MSFRFKHFVVEDQSSTMRVGTDAMLLGSWALPPDNGWILDVGTGCGVLALMVAQKTKATVDAIEIDSASAGQATQNFMNSPWSERMQVYHGDFLSWFSGKSAVYDFILSNPPYFSNSLKSDRPGRNQARHDISLNYHSLFYQIRGLLKPEGEFCVIFPVESWLQVNREATSCGLFPRRVCHLFSGPAMPEIRVMVTWGIGYTAPPVETELVIRDADGNFSAPYLELTRDYHQFIP